MIMPAISKRSYKKWLPQYTYTVSYPIFIGNQEMFSLI
jgi:hypothetical protein